MSTPADGAGDTSRGGDGGRRAGISESKGGCTIFVAGISPTTTKRDLSEAFSRFGKVSDLTLRRQRRATSRRIAYVTFAVEESAKNCLLLTSSPSDESEGGTIKLGGCRLKVMQAMSSPGVTRSRGRRDRGRRRRRHRRSIRRSGGHKRQELKTRSKAPALPTGKENRKLFIGGLNSSADENTLAEYFSKWGDLEDIAVIRSSETGKSRRFGFVTYRVAEMLSACQEAGPHRLGGRRVRIERAIPRKDTALREAELVTARLFVDKLGDGVEESDLEKYFGSFGRVIKVEIMRGSSNGKKRGFAYVKFEDDDVVDRVISAGQHEILGMLCSVEKEVELPGSRSSRRTRSTRSARPSASAPPPELLTLSSVTNISQTATPTASPATYEPVDQSRALFWQMPALMQNPMQNPMQSHKVMMANPSLQDVYNTLVNGYSATAMGERSNLGYVNQWAKLEAQNKRDNWGLVPCSTSSSKHQQRRSWFSPYEGTPDGEHVEVGLQLRPQSGGNREERMGFGTFKYDHHVMPVCPNQPNT